MRHLAGLRTLCSFIAAAMIAGASGPALAQEEPAPPTKGFALNRFSPSPAGDRMFGVQSAIVSGHLQPHAMILADYALRPLVLRRVGETEDLGAVVGNQLFLHLNGGIALWDRVSLNVDIPFALYQDGDSPNVDGASFPSPSSAQLSDIRLAFRVRFAGGYYSGFQIGFGGYIWIPTGSSGDGSFVGDGTGRWMPQLITSGRVANRVVWAFAFGPEVRSAQTFANVYTGTNFNAGLGLGVLVGEERHLQLGVESTVIAPAKSEDATSRNTNLELLASARYRFLGPMELAVGVGPGLTSGIGTPILRAVASVAYTPEPEKPKPPPTDRDRDGVIDEADACPDVPGKATKDTKTNGCPPPPDKDQDGIIDAQDACPSEAGPPNADPKKNGCPPPADKDQDGITDAEDACPDVAGVADPDPKKHGCPADKDGDGVPDASDACVDIPGLKTSDPATNGCPGDTDGDGIRDDKDACPTEKGKADPDPAKNGCRERTRVTEKEIIILQQVQFDTARATIKKVSDALLDEVADVLKEHPEITKIEVQGHTDNVGADKLNERLSDARAKAVVAALVKRGIAADRLVGKGYGEAQPIDTNDTPEGRQKNRRVQFNIAERTPKK